MASVFTQVNERSSIFKIYLLFNRMPTNTTLFLSRPTPLSIAPSAQKLVHFLSLSSDMTDCVAYLEPYTDPDYESTFFTCTILQSDYAFLAHFNWQASDQAWKGVNPVIQNRMTYEILNLNYASVINNVVLVLRTTMPNTTTNNNQRRVIYVGYWLSDKDIEGLVDAWLAANITHVLLTFITQPDPTRPLSEQYSMTAAFKELSTMNQDLLVNNFVVGVSYGGAGAMPVPYSDTFALPTSYYRPISQGGKGAEGLAADLVNICGTKLKRYFDLDIEGINQIPDNTPTSTFLGQVSQALKSSVPTCVISHAPQTPYFTEAWGFVYLNLYKEYKTYVDWFNIQYYNNGVSDTYEQIWVSSVDTRFDGVAVRQLMDAGIDPSYIVVGKPVNTSEGEEGFVPLPTLATYFTEAFQSTDPQIQSWARSTGGSMIWYYNTQTAAGSGKTFLSPYTRTVYDPQPTVIAETDNQALLNFMFQISQL